MKTIFLLSIGLLSLLSCSKTQKPKYPDVFRFYHADTNIEIKSYVSLINAMQRNKAYRLDLRTGKCYNYTTNKP